MQGSTCLTAHTLSILHTCVVRASTVCVHTGSLVAAARFLPALSLYMEFAFDKINGMTWFSFTALQEQKGEGGEKEKRRVHRKTTSIHLLCVFSSCLWHVLQTHCSSETGCILADFFKNWVCVTVKIGKTLDESLDAAPLQPRLTRGEPPLSCQQHGCCHLFVRAATLLSCHG